MNDVVLAVGSALRRRRRSAGMTLVEVSRRSGVAVPQLSRIENGKVDARISTVARILHATNGTLADLDVTLPAVVDVDDVLARRVLNRSRLEAAGVGPSDPSARLDEREFEGDDVAAERAALLS